MKIALKEEEDKQVLRKRRTPRSMTHGTFLAHNDARSIKKDGWIDTGVSEGWNKNHTKWTISRVKSKSFGLPWGHSKRFATWGCKNFLLGMQCLTLILGVYRFMHDDLQTKLCLSYRLENRTWPTISLVGHEQDSKSLILKCQLVFFCSSTCIGVQCQNSGVSLQKVCFRVLAVLSRVVLILTPCLFIFRKRPDHLFIMYHDPPVYSGP